MPTVISDPLRLAFVHVPKCGGSSIGYQLAGRLPCDPFFLGTEFVDCPGLGTVMPSHLPLRVLRDHFPSALARLRRYDSYAIVREPGARFASALAQHAREIRGRPLESFDRAGTGALVDEVIAAFAGPPAALLHRYVHFLPQADFLVLDGEEVVRHLFPIEELPRLGAALTARAGIAVSGYERHNATNYYRSPFAKAAIRRLKPLARRLLPPRLFQATRSAVLAVATERHPAPLREVLATPRVQDFVARTYGPDAALHARIRAGTAAA